MRRGRLTTKKNGCVSCIVLALANFYLGLVIIGWKAHDKGIQLSFSHLQVGFLTLESFLSVNDAQPQTTVLPEQPIVIENQSTSLVLNGAWRTNSSARSRFAYTFVIGGCNPEKPTYRFYLYNILVSAKILQGYGSKADVVAFFQLAWNTPATRLPKEEEDLLRALNVRLLYIPKVPHESFYHITLNKFRVLGLTEYERVLFLDGDVMPLENLDFLFELSTNGTLKENFVVRGKTEPANAGFFMFKPNRTHLELVNAILQHREAEARNGTLFDPIIGWGHQFEPGDEWRALHRIGYLNWTFYCSFSDQGLLYYWLKYVRSCVTIFAENGVLEHWERDANGTLQMEQVENPYNKTNTKIFGNVAKRPPDRGYFHFTGTGKPWFADFEKLNRSQLLAVDRASLLWQTELQEIARAQNFSINLTAWSYQANKPSLGMTPLYESIVSANSDLLSEPYE